MTFLPVVERELRVASRRRGTYWGRFAAGLIGSALAGWVLLEVEETEKNLGADLFQVVSAVVFLYATVAGTLVTCDCLSEEKREGTLGLLFLTDLKGHDVVLGKLVATSVNAFYGMLAVLPMLAIPFIIGGVSRAEMLRVVLVSINLLFFFLSIGLFVSAVCRKDNWALGLSILIGLAIVLGGPALAQLKFFSPLAGMISSPATDCFLAFEGNYNPPPPALVLAAHVDFWFNAAATHFYSWIFFGMACWIVPRSWQDAAIGAQIPSLLATPAGLARTRRKLLDLNPYLWRVARAGHKRTLVWATLFILAALWWWSVRRWLSTDLLEPGVDLLLLVPVGLVLKIWLAAEASRTLSEDRRSGGMELLLSTPLDEREIVRGQLMALRRQFGPPLTAVLLAYFVFYMVEVRRWRADIRMDLVILHLLLGGFLAADLIALSRVGMWLGLIHRKPNRAALLALTRILALPVVFFVLLISLWGLSTMSVSQVEKIAFGLWLSLGLCADLYFGLEAASKLRGEFRTFASEGAARKTRMEPVPRTAAMLMETP